MKKRMFYVVIFSRDTGNVYKIAKCNNLTNLKWYMVEHLKYHRDAIIFNNDFRCITYYEYGTSNSPLIEHSDVKGLPINLFIEGFDEIIKGLEV